MRIQVGFVHKVHDDPMRKASMVRTMILAYRNGDDTRDDLLERLDAREGGREFFSSGLWFGLEQDDVCNHVIFYHSLQEIAFAWKI